MLPSWLYEKKSIKVYPQVEEKKESKRTTFFWSSVPIQLSYLLSCPQRWPIYIIAEADRMESFTSFWIVIPNLKFWMDWNVNQLEGIWITWHIQTIFFLKWLHFKSLSISGQTRRETFKEYWYCFRMASNLVFATLHSSFLAHSLDKWGMPCAHLCFSPFSKR